MAIFRKFYRFPNRVVHSLRKNTSPLHIQRKMEAVLVPPYVNQVEQIERIFFGPNHVDKANVSSELHAYQPTTSLQDGDTITFDLPPWQVRIILSPQY